MLSCPMVYAVLHSLIQYPITTGWRDDVSSKVLLMGLLAGARVKYQRATESPHLCYIRPFPGGWAAHKA